MIISGVRTALIEVDVQNDFCPSYSLSSGEKLPPGALSVDRGDEVIPPLNALALSLSGAGGRVIATADWHPRRHVSFASSHPGKKPGDTVELSGEVQVLWPDHCVQGTLGAAFHEKLDQRPLSLIIHKGFRCSLDSYSAFFENDRRSPTGLEAYLRSLGIDTVLLGGLATDYCVLYSVLDALRLGFTAIVLEDAVRGVGLPAGSVEAALKKMKDSGALLIPSSGVTLEG
ncbi:MAG: bifunctional nicotinamidase/pyrazinamidase [Treponema sp.]|nr:bifunctional nicotinamidase/pyrazinamidase [Treponema sp.]